MSENLGLCIVEILHRFDNSCVLELQKDHPYYEFAKNLITRFFNETSPKMKQDPEQPERKDGRKKFVVYLNPKLIQQLKMKALQEDRHAYEVVEEILGSAMGLSSPGSGQSDD